jgi:hypothetical protein
MTDQTLSPLGDADEQRLNEHRAIVTRYLDED